MPTEEEKKEYIESFRNLMTHPGWELFVNIQKVNIEYLTRLVVKGLNTNREIATEQETNRLRDKIGIYEEQIDTPKSEIKRLSHTEPEEESLDPYQTVDQLVAERKLQAKSNS